MIILVAFILATAFVMAVASLFVAIVPPFTGAIVVRMGKPVRVIGPGTHFLFRPFEWKGELVSLKYKMIDDEMPAITKGSGKDSGEEVVSLDFFIEYAPFFDQLIIFLSFTQSQLEDAIKQRVKALLSIAVRKRNDRDEVYDNLKIIAQEVQEGFQQSFSVQYGVVLRFLIDEPKLPDDLVKEEVKREIQVKENERRKLDITAMTGLAKHIKDTSVENGTPTMDLEKAMKLAQVNLKIVPETRTIYDVGENVVKAASSAPGVVSALLDRFVPAPKLRRLKIKPKKEN